MGTPTEELTQRVTDALTKEGLLTGAEATKLGARILGGKIKAEDWLAAVENSLPADAEAPNGN